jgi:CRISPR-associated protein Cmr4
MTTRLYFVHVLSPLHAGTGQGSGVIDLPIAREKATGMPYLPGSSVKGVLRDKSGDNPLTIPLFGPKTENASDHAGSLQIADARLLLLPVRSLRGTFAWVTSPYALRRFARDASDVKLLGLPPIPTLTDARCDVTAETALKVELRRNGRTESAVVLEDLDLHPQPQQAQAWATWLSGKIFPANDTEWPSLFAKRFCIVSDDVFSFLMTTAIEVIARNRLSEETKTVEKGALWYEEALPAETVLYGLAVLAPTKEIRKIHQQDTELLTYLNTLAAGAMQFGGKATVGRGLCRMHLLGGA